MRGRTAFFTGGLLLFVYGVLFLVNDIAVLRTLAPIEFPDSAVVISNWIDKVPLWGEQLFRYGMIILPCFLIIAGLFGITGLRWMNGYNPGMGMWISSVIGIRLVILTIILQAAMVGAARRLLLPFYENLGDWLGFAAHRTSWCYWVSVLLLGFCFHIYLTGLEAAERDEWSASVIIHSATRAVFLLVFLPAGYVTGWLYPDSQIFADLPPMLYALYIALFIPIFRSIRKRFYLNESPLRDMLLTLGCVGALVVYYAVIGMAHSLIVDIYYIAVFMPGVFIFLLLISSVGFSGSAVEGYSVSEPMSPDAIAARDLAGKKDLHMAAYGHVKLHIHKHKDDL